MRRFTWFLGTLAVVLVGVTLLAVFPARTYFAQRRSIATAEERVRVLSAQNKQLSKRVEKLHTDAEIERIAREQYNLVRPGEEAYAILPPPEDKPVPKPAAPKKDESFWANVGDTLTFWD
jgi:cell division protein FtsB